MFTQELRDQIKNLELIARRLVSGLPVGNYRTKQKGSGFEFDQLRDYTLGDDIRFIDWKSSARAQKILTRQYLEDQQKTVILAIDISASTQFGSQHVLKSAFIKQVAGVLAFIALYHKDSVGLILFSDELELVINASTGRAALLKILEQIFSYRAKKTGTDINKLLEHVLKKYKKAVTLCIISDMCCDLNENLLAANSSAHDLFLFRCIDPVEEQFPVVGFLALEDRESGQIITINTNKQSEQLSQKKLAQDALFKKLGLPAVVCNTRDSLINQVSNFLKKYSTK